MKSKKNSSVWLKLALRKISNHDATSDGWYKVVIAVGFGDKTIGRLFISQILIKKGDWDQSKGQIKSSAREYIPEYKILNNLLLKVLLKKQDIATEINNSGKLPYYSTVQIMELLKRESLSQPTTTEAEFYSFARMLADEMHSVNRFGNEKAYRQSLSFMAKIAPEPLLFGEINYNLLKKLETFHLSRGHSLNGLSTYIRAIRAIYNEGVKRLFAGKYPDGANPFDMYSVKTTDTRKRALKIDVVQKLFDVPLEPGTPKWHYRNFWEFMLLARGMTAAEMARLKIEHVKNRAIEYVRIKTKNRRTMHVKINDRMAEILNCYMQGKHPGDFIFPFIKHPENPELWNDDIANTRRYIKKAMNAVAAEAGIDANVTTYVARHTWAVAAMHQTTDKYLIKQALGHESIKTTEIYLASFDHEFVDELQDSVALAIQNGKKRK